MSRPVHPPRLAVKLIELCIRDAVAREGALGDLGEELEELCATRSVRAARRWYRVAALRLSLAYLWARPRRVPVEPSTPHAPRRGDSLMQTVLQDLRFARRTLASAYGFTAVAVLTLAFGIGATTAMFSVLNAAFLRPLPFAEPERLVMGAATFDGRVNPVMSAYDFFDYREQADTLASFSAFTGFTRPFTLTGLEEAERVDGAWVSWDLFHTLGADPQAGRHMNEAEGSPGGPAVAVISDRLARRHFSSPAAAAGEILRIDGTPTTVVGVMPAGFHFTYDVDVWLPMRRDGPFAGARRFHNWLAVGRLADGVTLQQAQGEVDAISARLEAEYPESNTGKALLLADLHGALIEIEDQSAGLWLMMAAVSLLLLIACGNVANLLLARGSTRRAELAVRAALGASRARLVRLLLTESVVIGVAAGLAGLVLAVWLQRVALELMPLSTLGVERLSMSPAVLLFALCAALATSLLFGAAPALQGASADVAGQIKGAGRATDSPRGARLRSALVVAQVAVSMVLLVGSGLMIRSLAGLAAVPLGFAPENLVTVAFDLNNRDYPEAEQVRLFYGELLEEARALPGVVEAGMISQLPIRDPGNNIYVRDAAQPATDDPSATHLAFTRNVMPGYFEAMDIPLIAGRAIETSDTANGPRVMVIDETMAASMFPGEDPLGRRLVVDSGDEITVEVVGVVGAVRVDGLQWDAGATMYFPFAQMTSRSMRLAVRTGAEPAGVVASLRDLVRRLDPNLPVTDVVTMEAVIDDAMSSTRAITASLALFAGVALTLAVVGLYGVLAYHVAQRRREIGLRVALGAPRGRILRWVLLRGMALVAIGLVLGVAAASFAMRLIESLLFGVAGSDPLTFAGVAALFAAVALGACLIPALRATRVDPITALAAE